MPPPAGDGQLQLAAKILADLSERLISGVAIVDCPSLLAQVCGHLQSVQGDFDGRQVPEQTRILIRSLRAEIRRVQALLDSAALFYCGSLYASPSFTGSYTADGSIDIATPRRRFDFKV